MNPEKHRRGDITCAVAALAVLAGLVSLAVNLFSLQVSNAAEFLEKGEVQSERRVLVAAPRGRILASDGTVLAENRPVRNIVLNLDPRSFEKRSWNATVTNILGKVAKLAETLGVTNNVALTEEDCLKHIRRELALPLVVFRDIDDAQLARFSENGFRFPDFKCEETLVRSYPLGSFAGHVLGYVGRDRIGSSRARLLGGERYHFEDFEMVGKAGLEARYDDFLKGVPGEKILRVNARGFTVKETTRAHPVAGPDLVTTIDPAMQRAAERALEGVTGACVAIDPRDGSVLALASSPAFDMNRFEPAVPRDLWTNLCADAAKPLLDRAIAGAYAPGSTFKPVTGYAGVTLGLSPEEVYDCTAAFRMGQSRIRCASKWGHGPVNLEDALK